METLTFWEQVLADPSLQNLPYKVETNQHGQVVLSPHKPRHSLHQGELARQIPAHVNRPGRVAVEFAVGTPEGVKVPDVVWISRERLARIPEDAAASPVMPELVVEVISEANTRAEMQHKRRLYFEGGALEVWTCDDRGRISFFEGAGPMPASKLAPSFPALLP